MKKFVNDPQQFVPEMLKGIELANPGKLKYVPEYNLIMRADAPRDDKVSIVQGSGSGHEPAHVMAVGQGMLDAACPGDVFAAPPSDYVYETTKLMASPKGVLHIINNYTGDRMAFDMGRELAEAEDIKIATIIVDDDVAVKDSTYTVGRRGVAGNFFVIKAVGAASENGASLEELVELGERVNSVTRTMGMALTSCTPPAKGSPLFELGDDEMEMGVGIHGEPGRRREKLASANAIVDELLEAVVLGPALQVGRRGRADDQRPRRHADLRAVHPLRPRRTSSSPTPGSTSRAATSASTAPRSTWPAPRSRWSSSTTSSTSCSTRPPRWRSASSEPRAAAGGLAARRPPSHTIGRASRPALDSIGDPEAHGRSSAAALDAQPASGDLDALAHHGQAHVAGTHVLERGCDGEAWAIVGDARADPAFG